MRNKPLSRRYGRVAARAGLLAAAGLALAVGLEVATYPRWRQRCLTWGAASAAGLGTRFISRNRIAVPGASRLARALYAYVMEPGSLIMERKMLLGIKQRAERVARESRAGLDPAETSGPGR